MTSLTIASKAREQGARNRVWFRATISPDTLVFSLILVFANTHLLFGGFTSSLIFLPDAVMAGEWWRLLTFPFVHVTWYHLILDAGAFFILYESIRHNRTVVRILYVVTCGAFSLGTALLVSSSIHFRGLCGLSGIAHGLMAIAALEMMLYRESFHAGCFCLIVVAGKSIYEVIAGKVLFEFLHLGLCGPPIAACHVGGVLGGIVAFYLLNSKAVRLAHSR